MKQWCNGVLRDGRDPAIRINDHGFTIGDGVFETMKVVDGTPFALTRHLQRLRRSAQGLGLQPPDEPQVRAGIEAVLAANRADIGALALMRITLTSGPGPVGSQRGEGAGTVAITLSGFHGWPESAAVGVSPWPRNERSPLRGLKTTSYAENAVSLHWARERGYSEALLANLAGRLCEGTGSNVFVVTGGRVLTPPLASGCLEGITRGLVLEWCDAYEQDLHLEELHAADEVFLTSSTRDVQPVSQVDGRMRKPGRLTDEIRREFATRARDLDP